ncbi:MAG TPA: GTPase ObgE [Candidatus Dormibacteraeota bacterium]|jgi:GTP-binding protein|nr:GTPase ObgE [Candidatus Dormibacteraeota bacterium]
MFLDDVTLRVRSGAGGAGAVTFRKEKFVPLGGPDGGDGGRGGDVLLQGSGGLNSLSHLKSRRYFAAEDGGGGTRNLRHGADAAEVRILVPLGTVATDAGSGETLGELREDGELLLVARGGKGGRGNSHFAGSRNQAPRYAELGQPAVELQLRLELRLIADVGLVGSPNAGKSTLLAALTAATPKIADYPFTTLEPNLGVVEEEESGRRLVLADVPGLIEGASAGVGLGTDFLRHLSRTAYVVHVLDCARPLDECLADFRQVGEELRLYDPELAARVRICALNKVDLPGAAAAAAAVGHELEREGYRCLAISAAAGEGLAELRQALFAADISGAKRGQPVLRVYRPEPIPGRLKVEREGEGFRVKGRIVETLVARTDMGNDAALDRMRRRLEQLHLRESLLEAGARPGDTVYVGASEFLFDPEA